MNVQNTDKDACGGKLALDLEADGYIILTDGGGIWERFGKPDAREMAVATPEYLLGTKAGKNLYVSIFVFVMLPTCGHLVLRLTFLFCSTKTLANDDDNDDMYHCIVFIFQPRLHGS
jgi:hypothetical protein